jgi:hypothetical protein
MDELHELYKLVGEGTYWGAADALERVHVIKERDGTPAIFYNDVNSFVVLDETDPEEFRRAEALRHQG